MMLLPEYEPPEYETVFAADVMFYQSAKAALVKAGSATKAIERAERRLANHLARLAAAREAMEDYDERGNRRKGTYEKFESLAITAESYEYQATEAHGPLLQ